MVIKLFNSQSILKISNYMKENNKMELEIAVNDLDGEMINFSDFELPTSLKDIGWRLPTLDELKKMHQMHKENQLNFKNDWYMTSDWEEAYYNWRMNFSTGACEHIDVSESHWGCCRVRLVRNIL
jgi:hypothetical protein